MKTLTFLESALQGDVIKKLLLFTKIVYEECKERFGQKEQSGKNLPPGASRCQREVASIRENLRNLKIIWKKVPEHQKSALQQLCRYVPARLLQLPKAEKL